MSLALSLRLALHRRRRPPPGADRPLPAWALAELSLGDDQGRWLLRTLCATHALPLRALPAAPEPPRTLAEVVNRLAGGGLLLGAHRVADVRALARGDVLLLGDALASRLFGAAGKAGGGLALVIDVDARRVRFSAPLAPDAIGCALTDLQAAWPGWVLRARLGPDLQRTLACRDAAVATLAA